MTSARPLDSLFLNINADASNEGFAIRRAISRLNEIQTLAYFNEPHLSGKRVRHLKET